jgi:hypothetical protein
MPVLASLEGEIKRISVRGQPRQILHKTPLISKITRIKWIGGIAKAVECLLCKCKALISNPSPIKNK